ncbi:MAG: hypothetical protein J6P16_02630 [Eubacterium sp.]|nr:hypothetical protein [Eubacterium sp.]
MRETIRNHNNVYVFGTEARELDVMPAIRERSVSRPVISEEPETIPVKKQRIDVLAVLLIVFTFAAVMIVGIIYLNLNFKSTYLSKSVVKLQSEVVELQKSNNATQEQLEDGVNLKEIYKKATKELGMKPVKKSQIATYTSKKSSEIRQYGEIPS